MTKPTRLPEQACDRLAEALVLITTAARLDGKASFGSGELREAAARLARASSTFGLDAIVARALEMRGRELGLRSGTSELLTLLDGDPEPIEALLLADDAFRARIELIEKELEGEE